jgi:hypothetical protein
VHLGPWLSNLARAVKRNNADLRSATGGGGDRDKYIWTQNKEDTVVRRWLHGNGNRGMYTRNLLSTVGEGEFASLSNSFCAATVPEFRTEHS